MVLIQSDFTCTVYMTKIPIVPVQFLVSITYLSVKNFIFLDIGIMAIPFLSF